MKPRAAALLLAMAAPACTTGPNYAVPEGAAVNRPAANGAFASGRDKAFTQAELPDHWWQLYGDVRLDGFITEALAANTDLRAADANLRRADEVVRQVSAQLTVSTSIGGGASLVRAAPPSGVGGGLPGTAFYDTALSVVYPLDLAGKIRRAVEASRADAEAVVAARDEVRVTIAAEVARSYAVACSANLTLAANNRVLGLQRRTLDAVQRLQRGGRGTAFDVTRARAAADQSEAAIPSILAARTAELYRVATLMGRAPGEYPRDVEACTAPPLLKQPLPIGDGTALLRRRPDIRAAERTLAAATAAIGVAMADLYPQVSLGGSVGLGGPVSTIGSIGNAFSLSLGPLVSWTFPNRRIVRSEITQAGALADNALAQFDGTVLESLRQTETALSAYARERDRRVALERARADAATAADQAGRLYRFGRTDFLSLLTAQTALSTAEANLATSDALVIDRQVDLFRALGGGWQE